MLSKFTLAGNQGRKFLHPSLIGKIGYSFNQELQDRPGQSYVWWENRNHWVGFRALLWSLEYVSWLYNDEDSSIIFEITPIYPGNFSDSTTSYDLWIKNYRSYCRSTIPLQTAKIWLDQIKKVRSIIDQA